MTFFQLFHCSQYARRPERLQMNAVNTLECRYLSQTLQDAVQVRKCLSRLADQRADKRLYAIILYTGLQI